MKGIFSWWRLYTMGTILYRSWRLKRYRLPKPVLSLKQALLWAVIGTCSIGKSWWPGGVRSQKWSLLPRKLRGFLTFSYSLQSDHSLPYHFLPFHSLPNYYLPSPNFLPQFLPPHFPPFHSLVPDPKYLCEIVLSSVAWSTAKDFIRNRLPITSFCTQIKCSASQCSYAKNGLPDPCSKKKSCYRGGVPTVMSDKVYEEDCK